MIFGPPFMFFAVCHRSSQKNDRGASIHQPLIANPRHPKYVLHPRFNL